MHPWPPRALCSKCPGETSLIMGVNIQPTGIGWGHVSTSAPISTRRDLGAGWPPGGAPEGGWSGGGTMASWDICPAKDGQQTFSIKGQVQHSRVCRPYRSLPQLIYNLYLLGIEFEFHIIVMTCSIFLPLICLQPRKNEKTVLSWQIWPLAVVYQTLL